MSGLETVTILRTNGYSHQGNGEAAFILIGVTYLETLVGLYSLFLVLFFRLARPIFRMFAFNIMFTEMPYVDRVLQLCFDIYLVRENHDFTLEEDLFSKLIFFFRSPEVIIKWTRPPNEVYQHVPTLPRGSRDENS